MSLLTSLKSLPKIIDADNLLLIRDSEEALDYINRLTQHQKDTILRWWDNFSLTEDKKSYTDYRYYYNDADRYKKSIPRYLNLEHGVPLVKFWVISQRLQTIVGLLDVYGETLDNDRALLCGFYTLPEHRNKGFGSRQSQIISDYLLGNSIVDYVCAESLPRNRTAHRSLLRSGFSACGKGLVSGAYSGLKGKIALRFIKTRKVAIWPFPEA